MTELTLHIKNMVCQRCIMAVENCFQKFGVETSSIQLGTVQLVNPMLDTERLDIEKQLASLGFYLIDDRKACLVNTIKTTIIDLVHHQNNQSNVNLSNTISEQLGLEYQYLSHLFSEVEGITVEKYYIAQKIERVKELLEYDEITLNDIAFELQYSSVAYLSNQFKKVTGLTPTQYKKSHNKQRLPLDKV